jgi:hypothetical protein
VRKSRAREEEVEDAAAATMWRMSVAERVEGGMRRSLVYVWAMPPVAVGVVRRIVDEGKREGGRERGT